MTLSGILLAAPDDRPLWIEVGASMIAIDTLVHNFLVRTGEPRQQRGFFSSRANRQPRRSGVEDVRMQYDDQSSDCTAGSAGAVSIGSGSSVTSIPGFTTIAAPDANDARGKRLDLGHDSRLGIQVSKPR
jgi:hypothetical protein